MGAAAGHWDVMKNGLYSIHVTLLDGRTGKGSGAVVGRSFAVLYTVIDGKIARSTLFRTKTEAFEAAGLSE